MNSDADMRIPVLFDASGAADRERDAWLVEEGAAAPRNVYTVFFTQPAQQVGHVIGCACCIPHGPAADALTRMFRARSTGAAPFFKRVVVRASPAGEAAVREALAQDVVMQARYTLKKD